MTQQVLGFAAQNPTSGLATHQFERRDLRPDDVQIEITYCGVCHSDLHMVRNDWGVTIYPIVPGHEIIGHVKAVGENVKGFRIGETVGVGCMVDSCQHCESCTHDLEQYCEKGSIGTYSAKDPKDGMITYGGYSQSITVNEKFVLHVSNKLDEKAVAPILCAGITTWSPLRHWNVGQGSKVAVIGLGGLGHMAIKLAHALGAEVTLFTRSPNKAEDARKLGAHNIVLSTDSAQMAAVRNAFDLIIDTVPYQHDLNPYVPTLKVDGTLVLVGLVGNMDVTSTVPLVLGRRTIAGSCIGGIKETQELLDFCAKHNILPEVEMINMQDINDAYIRMEKSDVKYRFVIDMASLGAA